MKLEVLKFLADIQRALNSLQVYGGAEMSYSDFKANEMLQAAVERKLTIIGEALFQIDKIDKDVPITDKKKIKGLRHILVHDYDKINPETLYTIITKNIDLLKKEVETILIQYPPQGSMTLDD